MKCLNRNVAELCIKFWKSHEDMYYSLQINSTLGSHFTHEKAVILVKKNAVLRGNLNIMPTVESSLSNMLKEYLSYSQKYLPACRKLGLGLLSSCQGPLLEAALGVSGWGSLWGSYSIEEAESWFLLHQKQEKYCYGMTGGCRGPVSEQP